MSLPAQHARSANFPTEGAVGCLRVVRVLLIGLLVFPIGQSVAQDPRPDDPGAPGGFGGRIGAWREKLVRLGGGNAATEAAVARGLNWLALHQADDGSWSLGDFNKTTREKPLGQPGKVSAVADGEKGVRENKIAATAFAILPFLGAGQTHKVNKDHKVDYSKTVQGGLDWLMRQQGKDGSFGSEMYSNAVATLALCEAHAMTADPRLKASATAAIRFFIEAQHEGGGWRYQPRQAGDLSVTGWVFMAIQSAELGGIAIPKETRIRADRFLDTSYDEKAFGYRYIPDGGGPTPTMTAVGLLCRLYRGATPANVNFLKTVETLKKLSPSVAMKNFYHAYYATQVMHHLGGEAWDFWNLGPKGDGNNGMRNLLLQAQDDGQQKAFRAGSWAAGGYTDGGSRVISTSMALLMLEVYYRHLPLHLRAGEINEKP